MGASNAMKEHPLGVRLDALSDAHKRVIRRFRDRLSPFVEQGLLTKAQAAIIEEHIVRLGERNRNPANTGNLEDLFCYTLSDTGDPIRAYAQVIADSEKTVPMDDGAELVPALKTVDNGQIFRKVGDLAGYNYGDKMLITHTMVAYGDAEHLELARRFVRATYPDRDEAAVEREVARMAVQSQHGPSSTFVLARMRGLTVDLPEMYRAGGYSEAQIADALRFYEICASFDPKWVDPFLDGFIPTSSEWDEWRRRYLDSRHKLPEELIYQLSSDTLTNFLDGTMNSGKWTDASIVFGGVSAPEEVPFALARIVNQYIAEHIALHDRPAKELAEAVEQVLEPWGVGFDSGRAVMLTSTPKNVDEIKHQFDAAWARRHRK